jgi:catechol 2,3-dioxygenase-like lactoylglutathione lyase family enzyme
MQKLQTQGVHHITLVGADRKSTIDFWEGVLGMPFVFDQPNLDVPEEGHLYFDPGDGRLITIFTNETRRPDPTPNPVDIGDVHHIAFSVSHATFAQAVERLAARGIANSGPKDRGFMDSIYFRDPLGQLYELASYRFEPPAGRTHAEVLLEAHRLRVASGDYNIQESHLADAIETMIKRDRGSLSSDRSPKDPYKKGSRKGRSGPDLPSAEGARKKRTLGNKAYGGTKTARRKRTTRKSERTTKPERKGR